MKITNAMNYYPRIIDKYLSEWAKSINHKPILLRGARQVGKSSAIRQLGTQFDNFIEINFEKYPNYKEIFKENLDVHRIISQISILIGEKITDNNTLLFFDEIQECKEAIMSLRFFKEDRPNLHVIAAGSLLEFALADLPTFGVGRIHSMFMYPMTFDEFLLANNDTQLIEFRDKCNATNPLPEILKDRLIQLFRNYIIVGGMPEVVDKWVTEKNLLQCQELQDDLLLGYEDDFSKYAKKADPVLLRNVFRNCASQLSQKFVYSQVPGKYKTYEIKNALDLLTKAGLLTPVFRTAANGLPLGGEINEAYQKILILDSGITLRLLKHDSNTYESLISDILTSSPTELINKGPLSEMIAGNELLRYRNPNVRHELYYWTRQEKNSLAEIDYVISHEGKIIPVEIKAATQGGMKSLWMFLDTKHLNRGIRCSLENFGKIQYSGALDLPGAETIICPLYAISQIDRLLAD